MPATTSASNRVHQQLSARTQNIKMRIKLTSYCFDAAEDIWSAFERALENHSGCSNEKSLLRKIKNELSEIYKSFDAAKQVRKRYLWIRRFGSSRLF